jgi:hypothetical protein
MKKSFTVVICILFLAVSAIPSKTHRFHTSLTRIDYNAQEKLGEISIQLFSHDLVPVLERYAKKNIDIEKTPGVDKIILQYLEANFILRDAKGVAKKLAWVGKKLNADIVEIYIETAMNEDFEGYTLRNTIFFEAFREQINVVVARYNEKKIDLSFKVGDKEKSFSQASEIKNKR